jgi:MerR family copper efflux transcriptional regulator
VTTVTVNELARRAGIPAHVVRYYTQCGLLSPARNSRNAYRQYGDADLHRLRFICRVKLIGFTLSEIDLILRAVDEDAASLPAIRDLVRLRAEQFQKELASAQRLQQRIIDVVERWGTVDDGASERQKLQRLIEAVALEEASVDGSLPRA